MKSHQLMYENSIIALLEFSEYPICPLRFLIWHPLAEEAGTHHLTPSGPCSMLTAAAVAGGATHAGKSTVCLGVLQAALEKYGASKVAYVKAATQDEREDTVSRFCAANKIE